MSISLHDHVEQGFLYRAARAASLIPLSPFGTRTQGQNRHANSIDGTAESAQIPRADPEKDDAFEQDVEDQRAVRTLPPWVLSFDEEDGDPADVGTALLLQPGQVKLQQIPEAHEPHRNFMPSPRSKATPGHKFDHARSDETAIVSPSSHDNMAKWQRFARASQLPRSANGQMVDEEWLKANLPDLDEPWGPGEKTAAAQKQEALLSMGTIRTFQRVLLRNPFVPLVIRLIVLVFVCTALGLGVWIYQRSTSLNSNPSLRAGVDVDPQTNPSFVCKQQASTYLAFIVDAAAILYLIYITWDEYFSAPLGLRSSRSKMRLLFLDLIFIVFSSANLSLAFSTLTDQQWSCYDDLGGNVNNNNLQAARTTCVQDDQLCDRQKSLVSVLVVALIAWLTTFALSTMRVVERITR